MIKHPTAPILVATILLAQLLGGGQRVEAATITAEYAAGHRNVSINDYRTPAMGTFTLVDGGETNVALCVEAADGHSMAKGAYAPVSSRVTSSRLDALLWLVARQPQLDDDTATAAAALAWHYARAMRDIGVPVWADGTRNFDAVTPTDPEPWDGLRPFGASHPIGLRSGYNDLDSAEIRLAELHRLASSLAGPWQLELDETGRGVRLVGAAGAIANQTVTFTVTQPDQPDQPVERLDAVTDGDGRAVPELPELAEGATITATVAAPGEHREWDGQGAIQRMAAAITVWPSASFTIPPLPVPTTQPPPTVPETVPETIPETVPATIPETVPATEPATSAPTTIVAELPATSSTTTTVAEALVVAPQTTVRRALANTGSDATGWALRAADAGFVLGVALIAVTALIPSRRGRDAVSRAG